MNLSYFTGRLVKSGPTNVGLVIIRFHPKNLLATGFVLKNMGSRTLLVGLLSGLDNLEHLILSDTPDLWQRHAELGRLLLPLIFN
jgi:hypothetical protein